MEKYSLGSIKRDSIRRVFACIKKKDLVSRLEISKETGLSLMTVGKIADDLADKNIITQQKGTAGSVGRKANYISLNKDNFSLILDLSDRAPSFAIVNVGGDVLYTEKFEGVGDKTLISFFERAKTYTDMNYLLDPCMGVGVIVGDRADFEKDFRAVFDKYATVATTSVKAQAVVVIADESSALYFDFGRKYAAGVYILDGEICDIDGIVSGNTFEAVSSICTFLSPEKIVLDGEIGLREIIGKTIMEKCPKSEVLTVDTHESDAKYVGCAALVADEYINITK